MKNHRLISVLCAISMSLTLVLPVGAENVHSQPSNQLNESASAETLFTYAEEIELAEEMAQCTITQINDATLQILAQTAIEHLDNMQYSFRDMMDDIGEAFSLQSVQANNIPMTRANNEVIKNLKTVTLIPFGPLKGQYKRSCGVGETVSGDVTFNISIGSSIQGISLNADIFLSASTSLQGPPDGTKLYNGMMATGRYGCGVLYGSVTKTTWDLCDKSTGKVLSSHQTVVIPQTTAYIQASNPNYGLASDGSLYVDSGSADIRRTAHWTTLTAFISKLESDPGNYFLKGIGNK